MNAFAWRLTRGAQTVKLVLAHWIKGGNKIMRLWLILLSQFFNLGAHKNQSKLSVWKVYLYSKIVGKHPFRKGDELGLSKNSQQLHCRKVIRCRKVISMFSCELLKLNAYGGRHCYLDEIASGWVQFCFIQKSQRLDVSHTFLLFSWNSKIISLTLEKNSTLISAVARERRPAHSLGIWD